jgi:hypothetical protein
MCIIGVKSQPLIVFIVLDAALNPYLTLLFAIPLRGEFHILYPQSVRPQKQSSNI